MQLELKGTCNRIAQLSLEDTMHYFATVCGYDSHAQDTDLDSLIEQCLRNKFYILLCGQKHANNTVAERDLFTIIPDHLAKHRTRICDRFLTTQESYDHPPDQCMYIDQSVLHTCLIIILAYFPQHIKSTFLEESQELSQLELHYKTHRSQSNKLWQLHLHQHHNHKSTPTQPVSDDTQISLRQTRETYDAYQKKKRTI